MLSLSRVIILTANSFILYGRRCYKSTLPPIVVLLCKLVYQFRKNVVRNTWHCSLPILIKWQQNAVK